MHDHHTAQPARPLRFTPEAWFTAADCTSSAPMDSSGFARGVRFTGRHRRYTRADTWYPSWASDGHLYSGWTDGAVDQWTCSSVGMLAATGHARVVGDDPLDLAVEPLGTRFGSPHPYGGRYPCGSLRAGRNWFIGSYCLSTREGSTAWWDRLGPFVGFRTSGDEGLTWQDCPHTGSEPLFLEDTSEPVRFGAPKFVDFGQDMQHSPDGKAYLVAHGSDRAGAQCGWMNGDQVRMARVQPDARSVNDPSAYEFYAGHAPGGRPLWADSLGDSVPLVEWPDMVGCVTLTYWPSLNRYFMWITSGGPGIGEMDSYLLESSSLTGPYGMVAFLPSFGRQAYFLNMPSKFLSQSGARAWLCYSANYTNDLPEDEGYIRHAVDPAGSGYGLVLQELALDLGGTPA